MPQRHLIQRHRVTPLSNIRDHERTQRRPGYIPPHHAARTPAQSAAVSVGILLYGPTKLGPRRLEAQCAGLQDPYRGVQKHCLTSPDILRQGHVLGLLIECSPKNQGMIHF